MNETQLNNQDKMVINIYKALDNIMQEIEAIGKNKTNQMQGYKFRGIDDMYNALQPLFKKNHVFITSNVLESKREERITTKGGTLIYTIAKCQFKFFTTDGSFVESILEGEAMDSGDKSTNKAMSTALKYALMQMFLIPTEEVLDTEYESHKIQPKKNKELPPYIKIHKDREELIMAIDFCENLQELKQLYELNKENVKEQLLTDLFSEAKKRL